MICSQSKYEFLAEKPTKYFINLEKRNFAKKTIYRLQKENNEIITDPLQILQEQEDCLQSCTHLWAQ